MVAIFFFILSLIQLPSHALSENIKNLLVEIEKDVRVRGICDKTLTNRSILAFRGIPYAEPPIGELRFKRPVPKQWVSKYFDATKDGPQCVQINYFILHHFDITGQEDCLTLNVYTHNTRKPLRKVIIFIHGGAFVVGSSNDFGPRRLLDHDVVLVTINYRLSFFGFLSTLDDECPGNFGLFDQLEAFKWVQRNIEYFGGDRNKVTIVGQSAGSVSVFNHIISPVSKGLFHRAIGHSGNLLCPWSEQTDPLKWTNLLAEKIDCMNSNTSQMMRCLRKASLRSLYNAGNALKRKVTLFEFMPVADGYFHSDSPAKLFKNGQISNRVPLLTGYVKDEGLVFSPLIYLKHPYLSNELITDAASMALNIEPQCLNTEIIELITLKYFNDIETAENLQDAVTNVITDGQFRTCHYETIQILLKYNMNPFVFVYDYVTNHRLSKLYALKKSVVHSDDMFFLFDAPVLFPFGYKTPNDKTENRFLDIWMSFAENGYPTEKMNNETTIHWLSAQPDHIYVNHLNKEITVENYEPDQDERLDFWLKEIPAVQNTDKC